MFDVLVLEGRDVMSEPLSVRRELLRSRVLPKLGEPVRHCPELNASLAQVSDTHPKVLRDARSRRPTSPLRLPRLDHRLDPLGANSQPRQARPERVHRVMRGLLQRIHFRVCRVTGPNQIVGQERLTSAS